MKYLLINQGYFPQPGGVENSLRHMAIELSQNDHQVHILTSNTTNDGALLQSFEVTPEATVFRYRKIRGIGYFLGFLKFLYLIVNHDYNKIICRSYILSVYCIICRKPYTYISPASVGLQDKPEKKYPHKLVSYNLKIFLQEITYKHANEIFVFSENMRQHVCDLSSDYNVKIIYPGCDTRRFCADDGYRYEESEQINGSQTKTILCVGRLNNVKGFDHALRIFALVKTIHQCRLQIVGSGPERDNLAELCRELKLNNEVEFVGSVTDPERFYSNADCFLFTSTYEPFGQVLLEAAMAKLPIVCYQHNREVAQNTATKEIFSDFPAAIQISDNYKEVAEVIVEQLKDPKIMLEADYLNFVSKHSWSQFTKIVVGLSD